MNVSEEHTASISVSPTMSVEATSSIETSGNIYQITLRHILDDSNLHEHCFENLTFHNIVSDDVLHCVLAA
jgi:hypothetical protein